MGDDVQWLILEVLSVSEAANRYDWDTARNSENRRP